MKNGVMFTGWQIQIKNIKPKTFFVRTIFFKVLYVFLDPLALDGDPEPEIQETTFSFRKFRAVPYESLSYPKGIIRTLV